MGRQFSFWVLLGFVTLFAVSFHDVQVNADVGPTESECRPYIEKALNELKTGEQSEGDDAAGSKETELSTEDTGGETPASAEDAPIEETTEQTDQVSGEEADAKGDSQEETGDQEQSTEVGEEKTSVEDQQESQEQTGDQKASTEGSQEQPEEVDEGEAGDTTDSKEHEEKEEASEGEHDQEGEKSTEEGEAGTVTEEEVEASEEVVQDQKVSGEEIEMEHGSVEEQDGTESSEKEEVASTEKQEEEASTEQEEGASAEQEGVSAEQQEGASTEQEGASVEQQDEVSAEQQEEDASSEKQEDDASQEGAEQDVAVSAEDQEAADTQSEEKKEEESAQAAESAEEAAPGDETHEESVEDDTHAVSEEVEATTAEQETTEQSQEEVEQSAEVGESTKEEDDQESAEVKSRKRRSLDDDESGGSTKVSEKSAEEVEGDKEGSLEQQEVSEEGADKSAEAKVDQPEESEETKSETKDEADSKEEEKDETKEEESSEKEEKEAESQPEDDLLLEIEIPENLRDRKQINELLHLDEEFEEREKAIDNVAEVILRDLKRIYDNAIKPLEALYKYRDLSNRHYGDPEIFSKPLILFMGPWSGGKSSIINYLTDNEYTVNSLRTGADPSPAYFNILMYGNETEILDGTQLAADYTFSGLQKFGQGLQDRLHGLKLPSKLLEKVNIVEIPGILEVRKQVSRLFPFNDACQWFIDRADVIFLIYDPSKLDVGPETEAILDQLKGREYQTRIVLNKADQVKPEELLPVQSALIWNISPLMSSAQPPIMYTTSLWSHPYESTSPVRLLQAQERAFLRDIRNAIDKRIENKIASARRFAVRVRNHAKMVDCYLTTYYNHKTLFGNKKRISDEIIDHPQNYHIYEGLSTLTNISRYDLPDPEVYRDFFRLNPLYEFKKLSETCTYFRGCPINKLDVAIAYDLPELVGKYKKMAEAALNSLESSSNDNEMEKNKS